MNASSESRSLAAHRPPSLVAQLVVVGEVRDGPLVCIQAGVQARQWPATPPGAVCTAGEDSDSTTVVSAGRERATDRERNRGGAVLTAQQQDVDHLPRGVRAAIAAGQRRPQLIEAAGPAAPVALLGKRHRVLKRTGLAGEQLEVVIELGAGAVLAVQPLMAGDLPA